jgi:hypothetical protein
LACPYRANDCSPHLISVSMLQAAKNLARSKYGLKPYTVVVVHYY